MRISGELFIISSPVINGWLEANFEASNRLYGGNRENGGLANVNYNSADNRNDNIAGRPLVVSKQEAPSLGAS